MSVGRADPVKTLLRKTLARSVSSRNRKRNTFSELSWVHVCDVDGNRGVVLTGIRDSLGMSIRNNSVLIVF